LVYSTNAVGTPLPANEESGLHNALTVYYGGMAEGSSDSPVGRGAVFRTTQWSLVINAGSDDSLVAAAALEQLCQRYWFPLYACVRRSGYSHADAADLTQLFFARLLEKKSLTGLEPGVARFRSFLLTALKHFLINEWQSANRLKRGGGKQIVSLDENAGELYRAEPADHASPDKLFEKRWALSVIDLGLARLRAEFVASERPDLFDELKPTLTGDKLERSYADIGSSFGLSESAVKVAVHRMRKRFGELIRAEIAETVQDPGDVEDEMPHLIAALSN
jgi:RNA polymerase sigma-70 factor (ECF subfamily)